MGKIECTVDFESSNLFLLFFFFAVRVLVLDIAIFFVVFFFVRLAITISICFLFEFRLRLKNKTGERLELVLLFRTNMKWNHAEIEDTPKSVHTLRTKDTSTNTHTGAEMLCAEVASHAKYRGFNV